MFQRYREIMGRRETEGPEFGFTLIELLIVIIVLGILAAIVIFSLTGVTGQSEAAACNSDAKTAQTSVSAYSAENNDALPSSWGDLTATGGHGPYLHAKPTATVASNGYLITLTTAGVVEVTTKTGPTPYDSGGAALCSAL